MAILLLLLLSLMGLALVGAILENTAATTVTIAGQDLGGLSLGGWLLVFAVLGFIAAYLFLGMLAAARRERSRRRALRSSEREMAERVAALERENLALRGQPADAYDGTAPAEPAPAARDDTLVDQPAHRNQPVDREGHVQRDGHGRRLTPPDTAHAVAPAGARERNGEDERRDRADRSSPDERAGEPSEHPEHLSR